MYESNGLDYPFAAFAIIPSVVLLQMGLHKARPIDYSSALSTAPLVEPGVYSEHTINKRSATF